MKKLKSSDLRYGLDAVLAEVRNRALEEAAAEIPSAIYFCERIRALKSETYDAGRWVGIGGRGKRTSPDALAAAQEQADEAHQARVEALRMEEREGLLIDSGDE